MSGKDLDFAVHSTSPDACLKVFSYRLDKFTKTLEEAMKVDELRIQRDILSIKTSKSKGSPGSFTVTLASGLNYKKLISVGSWCLIYISDQLIQSNDDSALTNAQSSGLKMFGIIKTVRRQEFLNAETGVKYVRYVISGEDFQSFMNTRVFVHPILDNKEGRPNLIKSIVGGIDIKKTNPNPREVIETVLDGILAPGKDKNAIKFIAKKDSNDEKGTPLKSLRAGETLVVPKEVYETFINPTQKQSYYSFRGLLRFSSQIKEPIGNLSVPFPAISDATDLWSIIKGYSNPILNELYTDLLPAAGSTANELRPTLVFRPIPFSRSQKLLKKFPNKLLFVNGVAEKKESSTYTNNYFSVDIKENEILAFDEGKSENQRINFFLVVGSFTGKVDPIAQIQELGGIKNLGSLGSMHRHGLKPLIYNSNYDTILKNVGFTDQTEIAKDLHQSGHLYENGFVTMIGPNEHIPVGTWIRFIDRGWKAHVEGVNYDFSVEPGTGKKSYTATVAYVRLMTIDGNNPINSATDDADENDGQINALDRGVSEWSLDGGSQLRGGERKSVPSALTGNARSKKAGKGRRSLSKKPSKKLKKKKQKIGGQ